MALLKEAYQALEDVVGPDNISEDPAILDSYAYQWLAELINPDGGHFMTRPEAVALPGCTEEVQGIVKVCNKYKIKCKAFGTGWGAWAAPYDKDVVLLDLRRMDRILEIDVDNMYAVVEPYVIGATLQAEAMKVGLNTHMIGAGASAAIIAGVAAFSGAGADSISMGHGSENGLAMEWVLPNGDILQVGSLGSGCGWFCGEGPGPSAKGLVRGALGACGGMGVITKCAVKLYPWPGPATMPIEGKVPAYNSPLPENLRAHTLAFPTWQAFADACYKIYDSGIGYIAHRQFNKWGEALQGAVLKIVSDPTKQLDDLEEMLQRPEIQKLTEEMRHSFQIVLAGMTHRDIDYQEKVMRQILAETGGWEIEALADPEMEKWVLLYLIKLPFKNLNFAMATYEGSFAHSGTPDFEISYIEASRALKRKYIGKGVLADDGGEAMMAAIARQGGGGVLALEQFFFYDPQDINSVLGAQAYLAEAGKVAGEMKLGPGLSGQLLGSKPKDKLQQMLSSVAQPSVFHYQRKIKEAFNPNDIGDGSYVYLEEPSKK